MTDQNLVFLKLGGSLITDKTQPLTPRLTVIKRIASEIAQALQEKPDIKLLLGHGSGSFGHAVASGYQTQHGGQSQAYWQGFVRVWQAARQLNQLLVQHLAEAGIPVIAFPPSAGITARDGKIIHWDLQPIKSALAHKLVPLVQGDVIFDETMGGTIFSTEQVFSYLSKALQPQRILLAGQDPGVYREMESSKEIIAQITPENIQHVLPSLAGSQAHDVTGGMAGKVHWMLSLLESQPDLEVQVFSGAVAGQIFQALLGRRAGTQISS